MNNPGEATISETPVTTNTRNKTKKALPLVTPSWQVVGPPGEAMWVNICFSTSDLNRWQEKVKIYRENPSKVATRFEFIVKKQDPD